MYELRRNHNTVFIVRNYDNKVDFLMSLAWEGRTAGMQWVIGQRIVEALNREVDEVTLKPGASAGLNEKIGEVSALKLRIADTERQIESVAHDIISPSGAVTAELSRLATIARSLKVKHTNCLTALGAFLIENIE